ncbi:MAG TPA: ATP-binding protein, partial [Elusimicrobiales bacterium]|nr:ATP-binding protein [Elusimicrobiales bacterium]
GVIVAFKDVTERRRTERGIKLLHAATRIISDAPDLQTAMKLVLEEICEAGGWSAGEAFSLSRDGKRLECAVIWAPEPERLKNFIEASERSVFRKGEGLPGRVWVSLEPAWIKNVTQDANFPRLRAASEDGLKGAISVPVLADGEFVMSLDFFSRRELSGLTDVQTDFLPAIAAQLGHRILRKQADDARKSAMEQLVHGQKMESLGRTAGAIAHDFNNILTGTKGFVSLALETLPQDAPVANYIRQAADGINRGAALTQQLLAFSRNQASEMSDLDLNAVIKGMDAMLNMLFQHRIRLKLELDPELPKIRGNKSQLEQILMNLAVNARDAMSGAGEFAITTLSRPEESGRACSAEYEITGRTIRLSVSDTGPGIPEDIIDKIFEPFFTTKAEGKGTGMGLSTVYALVKTHKGGISVTSKPGRTTFDICFPAAALPEPVKR